MLVSVRLNALAGGVLVGLAAAGAVQADEGMIEYRQSIYKAVGGYTGAIAGIVKGEVPFKDDVKGHAHALAELSAGAGRFCCELTITHTAAAALATKMTVRH